MIVGIASGDYLPANKSWDNEEKWGGAGWARLGQYVTPLANAGIEVHSGILWKHIHGAALELPNGEFVVPDIIVLQRLMHKGLDETIRHGQENGQIFINDLDDWYWGLDHRNQAFQASDPKKFPNENRNHYWATIMASDEVTVSTPFLRDALVQRGYRRKITIIKNCIDVSRFKPVTQQDIPTFGWVGSTGHRSGDIEELRGIFPKYLNRGDLTMHHSGHGPGVPTFASLIGLSESEVSTSPRCDVLDYPSLLTMDVGLVPLRECDFNRAKSDIKGLEYAAAGIPFIASGLPAYAELHDDWSGRGFYLARKPKHWFQAINSLLDKETRLEHQSSLLELVKSRDISVGCNAMVDYYKELSR